MRGASGCGSWRTRESNAVRHRAHRVIVRTVKAAGTVAIKTLRVLRGFAIFWR
jgi:hypothetical protein